MNVAGGMRSTSRPPTLAIVAAVASSVRNRPIKAVDRRVWRGRACGRGPRHQPGCAAGPRGRADGLHPLRRAARQLRARGRAGRLRARRGPKCVGSARRADRLVIPCRPDSGGSPPFRNRVSRPRSTPQYHRSQFIAGAFDGLVLLVRALFVLAVTYAATLTRPFSASRRADLAIGVALGVLIVWIETRLRSAEVTDLLGALIGGAIGLGLAKTIGAALFWADTADRRVVFLHSFILLVFPYLGIVMGARKGEWLEPATACRAVPRHRTAEALPHPRHQRDHRRPHRRRLRDRVSRRHAGHPAVRAQGTAARRRLRRLAEAQPRAAAASTSCRRSRRCRASTS